MGRKFGTYVLTMFIQPQLEKYFTAIGPSYQSGTKPNLVAKILATKFGNLWA